MGDTEKAAFYCYAAPTPAELASQTPKPEKARYDQNLKEFIFDYSDVRSYEDPDHAILEFLQSTYEAAANVAKWDRDLLERR